MGNVMVELSEVGPIVYLFKKTFTQAYNIHFFWAERERKREREREREKEREREREKEGGRDREGMTIYYFSHVAPTDLWKGQGIQKDGERPGTLDTLFSQGQQNL